MVWWCESLSRPQILQVEFVRVLVGLFREYRVRPVQLDGEDEAAARRRLRALIKEDTGMKLLLQLMHPKQAVITCEKRQTVANCQTKA